MTRATYHKINETQLSQTRVIIVDIFAVVVVVVVVVAVIVVVVVADVGVVVANCVLL